MANRIAGITVEIGGDVGPLSRALESVNKTIKTTATQLKDVERLLKLDPSNTVLLTQKQETLKEKIGATKEKLDALKLAQEQAKQQMESGDLGKDKYDALQREIVATEQELKNLAREAAEANTALNKIDSVGKTLENVGGKLTAAGSALTRNVTAPVVALGTAAVSMVVVALRYMMLAVERFNNTDNRTIEEFFYGMQREILNEMMDCAITLILVDIMLESARRTFGASDEQMDALVSNFISNLPTEWKAKFRMPDAA